MSQKAKNWAAVFAALALAAVVVFGMFIYAGVRNIEMPVVPTADEIASKIVIPPIVIPEIPDTILSLRQDLKAEALNVCDSEFDIDEVEDLFSGDNDIIIIKEYTDDRDFSNINLGIDNVDDRTITIKRVYKVEVEPDLDDDFKEKVYETCKVTSDEGNLEAELSYYTL